MLKYTIRMRVNFAFCLGGAFSNYRRKVGDDIVSEVAAFYKPVHRMHSLPSPLHPLQELYYQGAESSKRQGGAKVSEGARFSKVTMFFCKGVIFVATLLLIILSLYSNIFDIAESLTQNDHCPI